MCVYIYIYIYIICILTIILIVIIYIFIIIIIIIILNFENSCATSYFCEYHDTFLGSIKKSQKSSINLKF